MEHAEVIGGIKLEPQAVKLEKQVENQANVVEIGAADIESDDDSERENVVTLGFEDIKREEGSEDDSKGETISTLGLEDIKDEFTKQIKQNNINRASKDLSESENIKDKLCFIDAIEDSDDSFRENKNKSPNGDIINVNPKTCKQKSVSNPPTNKEIKPMLRKWNKKMKMPTEGHDFVYKGDGNYKCNSCNYVIEGEREIKCHILKEHRMVRVHQCPYCSYQTPHHLRSHLAYIHTDEKDMKMFSCHHCTYKSRYKSALNKHALTHMDSHMEDKEIEFFSCHLCPYKTAKKKYLVRHSHMHMDYEDNGKRKFLRCHNCTYKARNKHYLNRHILTHMDEGQILANLYKCEQCPKGYREKDSLTRHVKKIHEKTGPKVIKCNQCPYQCNSQISIERHVTLQHKGSGALEMLKCFHCSYQTDYKHRLASHMRARHASKHFQCHICSHWTANKDRLALHLIGHKENKEEEDLKYRCDKCDYKTYRSYSLQIHKLNHLKPEEIVYFYCHHCDFKAKRKDNLKSHIFRHFKKEELTLVCYICDFTTKKRDQLVRHIDKHSKEFQEEKKKDNTKLKEDGGEITHSKELKEKKEKKDIKLKEDRGEIMHSKGLKEKKEKKDTNLKNDKHSKEENNENDKSLKKMEMKLIVRINRVS